MLAMLIEDDPAIRAGAAAALSRAGFAVTVAGSVDAAKAAVRRGIVDVLVMAERVGGRLAHDVALLAELRNPGLGTILLSDRTADEADEIFALLPSLHAVLGRETPPRMLTEVALATARWQGHEAPDPQVEAEPQAMAAPSDDAPPAALMADAPGPAPAAATVALPRVMPPPTATPNRVPSFLRPSKLTVASGAQGLPAPLPAPLPQAPVRRLHLA